jgi:succinate dehydrogenase hydrophobic anchor subunit
VSATVSPDPEPAVRSWSWHLLAVSSWLLLVMLPIQVVSTWLVRDPGSYGVAFYVDRWHQTGWRLFDWLFVVLALAHGGLGMNGVLGSLVRGSRARTAVAVGLGVVLGGLGLAVSARIFSFNLA